MAKLTRRAVFLDRDGTINKEVNYLYQISEFEFIPGAEEAIRILHDLGYLIIVITNQSGVARGYYTEEDVLALHSFVDQKIGETATGSAVGFGEKCIDAYYYCPHHPAGKIAEYAKECSCRKPRTGLVERALAEFANQGISIELDKSYFVGDKESDMETGQRSGIGNLILVRSGHAISEQDTIAHKVYDDLITFAYSVLNNHL